MLERKRFFPEHRQAPAVEGGDFGGVILRDGFEIIDIGQHFGCDAFGLGHHFQQNLEQLYSGRIVVAALASLQRGEGFQITSKTSFNSGQNIRSRPRAFEA